MTKSTKSTEYKELNIRTLKNDYWVEVSIKLSTKPPDHTTWDSDWDYYGYTEVLDWKVLTTHVLNEETQEYLPIKVQDEDEYARILDIIQDQVLDEYEGLTR
jgi:hypothetical protein